MAAQQLKRLILILACAIAVGCSTQRQPTEVRRQESVASVTGAEWIRTELFFGQSKPDGSLISTNDWNAFLEQNVLRRFPDGLTVLDGTGRYLGEQGHMYREPSKIVVLFIRPTGFPRPTATSQRLSPNTVRSSIRRVCSGRTRCRRHRFRPRNRVDL